MKKTHTFQVATTVEVSSGGPDIPPDHASLLLSNEDTTHEIVFSQEELEEIVAGGPVMTMVSDPTGLRESARVCIPPDSADVYFKTSHGAEMSWHLGTLRESVVKALREILEAIRG